MRRIFKSIWLHLGLLNSLSHSDSVAVEDSGVYVCQASNRYQPPATASAILTVLGQCQLPLITNMTDISCHNAPMFTEKFSIDAAGPPRVASLTVDPAPILPTGTTFTILCSVEDPPAPFSIHWYWNGILVPSTDSRFQMSMGEDSGTLTVYSPDQSYSGVYTCNVSTGYTFNSAQVTVTIGCKFTKNPNVGLFSY